MAITSEEEYAEILEKITVDPIGEPTMKTFDSLRKDLVRLARKLPTSLFKGGKEFGHLVLICEEGEYADYIGEDEDFEYQDPPTPDEFEVVIPRGSSDEQVRAKEREVHRHNEDYNKFLATRKALANAIAGAVDEEYVEELRHELMEYDRCQPFEMLQHIKRQIPITTSERATMKQAVFAKWDGVKSLRKFINEMKAAMKAAKSWDVPIQLADAVDHLVEQIYAIDPFEERVMTEWETRTVAKGWSACCLYFLDAADKARIVKKATAKQAGFESAANVREAAAGDAAPDDTEEHVNLILEQMEKNGEQMNAVAQTNAKLHDTIERQSKQISKLLEMNEALVKAITAMGGTVADKLKANKDTEEKSDEERNDRRQKKKKKTRGAVNMCNFCNKEHKDWGIYCPARKCNAHLRPKGWTGTEIDK